MPDPPNETGFKIGDRVQAHVFAMKNADGSQTWEDGVIESLRYDIDVQNYCFGVSLDIGGGSRVEVGSIRHLDVIEKLAEVVLYEFKVGMVVLCKEWGEFAEERGVILSRHHDGTQASYEVGLEKNMRVRWTFTENCLEAIDV